MRRISIIASVAALVLAIVASTAVVARSPVALGISSERSTDVAALNDYKATTGAKPALWTLWSDWGDRGGNAICIKGIGTCAFPSELARALAKRGVTPFIWWQPVDPANPGASTYTKYQNIIKGKHDAYIRDWAKAAKALGKPVVVRFAHEMNGKWFPWSINKHGNTNKGFQDMWRHVVKEFRSVGARNVKFLWSPYKSNKGLAPFYPGNEYVDYVGITSLNWGNADRWRTMAGLLEAPMGMLRKITRSKSTPQGKPVILPEVGSNHLGGDKAGWIRDGYAHAYKKYPTIRAMVYLDYDTSAITAKQPDWRLIMPEDGSAMAAYRSVASKPVFRASFP